MADVRDRRPRLDDWNLHLLQALIEICRGAVDAAVARTHAVDLLDLTGVGLWVYERLRLLSRVGLWAGDPVAALGRVEQALGLLGGSDLELFCGDLFALGARAAADLAETARARRDRDAERAALAAVERLLAAVERMRGRPFVDHRFLATVPGDRADWQAELRRARGGSDPDAWAEAAEIWQRLGRPHRTAYALLRRAEALPARSRHSMTAADVLRAAATAASGMAPLAAAIDSPDLPCRRADRKTRTD